MLKHQLVTENNNVLQSSIMYILLYFLSKWDKVACSLSWPHTRSWERETARRVLVFRDSPTAHLPWWLGRGVDGQTGGSFPGAQQLRGLVWGKRAAAEGTGSGWACLGRWLCAWMLSSWGHVVGLLKEQTSVGGAAPHTLTGFKALVLVRRGNVESAEEWPVCRMSSLESPRKYIWKCFHRSYMSWPSGVSEGVAEGSEAVPSISDQLGRQSPQASGCLISDVPSEQSTPRIWPPRKSKAVV